MSLMSCALCGREIVPGVPCAHFGPRPACDHVWRANGDYEYCTRCSINRKASNRHQFSGERVEDRLAQMERYLLSILSLWHRGERKLMGTLQELTQALKDFGVDLKAHEDARDAKDVEFQAKITDLLTNGALDQTALKDAFDALAADKALIAPPTLPIPPIVVVDGGTVTS